MAAPNDLSFPLLCSYLFHYICQDRIIYLCITDDVSVLLTAIAQTSSLQVLAFLVFICQGNSIMGANLRWLFSIEAAAYVPTHISYSFEV